MLNEADLSNALRRAFNLGQTYWQQADSEYTSQHRKADQTRAKFEKLVAETVAAFGLTGMDGAQAAEKLREDTHRHGHCPICHALHPQHHAGCTVGVTGRDACAYPECSGDPKSCPENEGYGCCKGKDGVDLPDGGQQK